MLSKENSTWIEIKPKSMKNKYVIKLKEHERISLERISCNSQGRVKRAIKAKILLKMHENRIKGDFNYKQVSQDFDVSLGTLCRMRRQFVKEGYEAVLSRQPYPKRKFDSDMAAKLVALYYDSPPPGHSTWSLRLLAEKLVERGIVHKISYERVRHILKKMNISSPYIFEILN